MPKPKRPRQVRSAAIPEHIAGNDYGPQYMSGGSDDEGLDGAQSAGMPPLAKNKKAGGRRKIEIEISNLIRITQYIGDKSRRNITFSKRRAGLMKKAHELSVLTGTDVMVLVASETGHVYTFSTERLQPLTSEPEGRKYLDYLLNDSAQGQVKGKDAQAAPEIPVPVSVPQMASIPTSSVAQSQPSGEGEIEIGYDIVEETDHKEKTGADANFDASDEVTDTKSGTKGGNKQGKATENTRNSQSKSQSQTQTQPQESKSKTETPPQTQTETHAETSTKSGVVRKSSRISDQSQKNKLIHHSTVFHEPAQPRPKRTAKRKANSKKAKAASTSTSMAPVGSDAQAYVKSRSKPHGNTQMPGSMEMEMEMGMGMGMGFGMGFHRGYEGDALAYGGSGADGDSNSSASASASAAPGSRQQPVMPMGQPDMGYDMNMLLMNAQTGQMTQPAPSQVQAQAQVFSWIDLDASASMGQNLGQNGSGQYMDFLNPIGMNDYDPSSYMNMKTQ